MNHAFFTVSPESGFFVVIFDKTSVFFLFIDKVVGCDDKDPAKAPDKLHRFGIGEHPETRYKGNDRNKDTAGNLIGPFPVLPLAAEDNDRKDRRQVLGEPAYGTDGGKGRKAAAPGKKDAENGNDNA